MAFLSTLLLHGVLATAQNAPADAIEPEYLRVHSETGNVIALEIAVQTFAHPSGEGPLIDLVGVAHIGESAYYEALQEVLDEYDLVLYESVKPAGTGGAGGETPAERIASTESALGFVRGLAEKHKAATNAWPEDVAALRTWAQGVDPRLPGFLDDAARDAWGNAIRLVVDGAFCRAESLGADGKPGGDGEARDLVANAAANAEPLSSGGDGIQAQLATALGLAFQLEAMDYGRDRWICSDMAADELNRALAARDVDFAVLEGTLAGSSLPARIGKIMLGLMRALDKFVDNAISDTMKVMMIEMLGDPAMLDVGLGQMPGLADVLIDERNQVVMDDLEVILAAHPEAKRVAIFYGAGHMPDLGERLQDQRGYEPADAKWLRAMEVDLTESSVRERDIRMIRGMLKRSLRSAGIR